MKNNTKPSRDFLTLDEKLDAVFFIDRIALIESDEEDPACPFFETVGEYVDFYRRLVGRRVAARKSLIHKSNEQAVEDEIQHLRQTIAPLVGCHPEMITPEERFYEIVPVKDQRKAWTNIFADFPGLISWRRMFFINPLVFLLVVLFFVLPVFGGIANVWFPEIHRAMHVIFVALFCSFLVLLLIILFQQRFYYRHRWAYHALTLRQIAQKIVDAKEKYIDYPIGSVDEVEPLLLKTLSECFDIPLDSLKPETRLDTDLGFEF